MSVKQNKADATCCRAILGHIEAALTEFEVAKTATDENSHEQYVVLREQMRSSLQNATNLANQGVQILDPPVSPFMGVLAPNQEAVDKTELEALRAAQAELEVLKANN